MSKGAFTLVEVVIATALLIVALALFLQSFVSAKRSAVMADRRMEAIENARSNMEILVSSSFSSAPLSNGAHSFTGTVSSVPTNISYSVVTQSFDIKNIYLTNMWINPASRITSTVSIAGSISSELHPP